MKSIISRNRNILRCYSTDAFAFSCIYLLLQMLCAHLIGRKSQVTCGFTIELAYIFIYVFMFYLYLYSLFYIMTINRVKGLDNMANVDIGAECKVCSTALYSVEYHGRMTILQCNRIIVQLQYQRNIHFKR